ncbi:hypothetical protein [Mycolicibacterium peregrinum]|uniref:Uncharacterized protein n=1 Tax=Mycolicibacterium peregrinum TaxID=43304 RepID=A0A1A1YPW6_MYCPR|nr:hypothetical protein [Mycolicibacterium peregrinum]OBB81814.1 hypothetical protein A5779_09615 [Mycolicibacterium peregrinum]OBF33361.1 hypothetical protein A5719_27385 [Mycolicibacterium peregrinum]
MSESVGDPLPTYTARVSAIGTILAKHLPVTDLVQNNRRANPILPLDCLSASWGPDPTSSATLTLSIHPVPDFAAEVEELRYGADPAQGAYEAHRADPGEFALVQPHLSSVWVVAGHCEVHLAHQGCSPEKLVEAAVEIARSIGWSPYTDDFEPPLLPPGWDPPVDR